MKAILAFAILLLATAFEEDGVVVLDDNTIKEAVEKYDYIMIKFYAPWCGHCKALAPEYAEAAKALKAKGVILAQVDATLNSHSASSYGVQGYPTIWFISKGVKILFKGERTKDGIIRWIEEKVNKNYYEITSEKELMSLQKKVNPSITLIVKNGDEESLSAYRSLMLQGDAFTFYVMKTDTPPAMLKNAPLPAYVLSKKYDTKFTVYDGENNDDAILKFMSINSYEILGRYNQKNLMFAYSGGMKLLGFLLAEPMNETTRSELYELALKYKQEYAILVSDFENEDAKRIIDKMGATKEEGSFAFIISDGNKNLYKMEDNEISANTVSKFINNHINKRLEKFAKSEKIPTENKGVVKKIVASNFKNIIMDSNKDVLVKFYSTNCPKCKEFAPKYEEAANKIKSATSMITFTEIDGNLNEIEGTKISSFPTLKFYPRNKKEGIQYQGELSSKALLDFIVEQTSFLIDLEEEPEMKQNL